METEEDLTCKGGGEAYALRDGCEPVEFCDACAHEEIERLRRTLHRLQHGAAIEGDDVCEHEVAISATRAERDEARRERDTAIRSADTLIEGLRTVRAEAVEECVQCCEALATELAARADQKASGSVEERNAVAGSVACHKAAERIRSLVQP